MALHIYIDTIPHEGQRYPTVGDYWRPPAGRFGIQRLEVRVSELADERYELLVAIHELIEEHLTRRAGISEEAITEFDVLFEHNRKPENFDEPGDDPTAPYHAQHVIATECERFIAEKLGVDWDEYTNKVNSL